MILDTYGYSSSEYRERVRRVSQRREAIVNRILAIRPDWSGTKLVAFAERNGTAALEGILVTLRTAEEYAGVFSL